MPRIISASSSESSPSAYASPPGSDPSSSSAVRPRKEEECMSSWVTTLTLSPVTRAFFCEDLSSEEEKDRAVGEVGVKGPDAMEGLEGSDGLTGNGMNEDPESALPLCR
jgi:hypothetical protein